MRIFIAIPLPEAFKKTLQDWQFSSDDIRWESKNFHITLKFVGDMRPELVNRLSGNLSSVRQKAFDLVIKDWGTFPQKGRPKVIWAGVEASDEMMSLQSSVEKICAANRIDEEQRPFVPHITLGKIKRNVSRQKLAKYLDEPTAVERNLRVNHFALFKSELHPDGAHHEIIKKYPLPETKSDNG